MNMQYYQLPADMLEDPDELRERWEVEFLDDRSVEAERFISEGEIEGEEALNELLSLYKEPELNGRHVKQRIFA